MLRKAIDSLDQEDGWAPLSPIGQQMISLAPDFDPAKLEVLK